MKKLFIMAACAVAGLVASAQGVATPPVGTQLKNADLENGNPFTNGTVIALQCLDTNGGLGYYFNGAAAKSAEFSVSNLYRVVTAGERFKLQNVENADVYVGNNSGTVANVGADDAETFVASIAEPTDWTTKPNEVVGGVNTIRFTASDNTNFLNTQNVNGTPKYTAGTGGYSAWYVYSFTDADVAELQSSQVDVTLNFTGIGGETLTTTVPAVFKGSNITEVVGNHCPEYFTATGVAESNTTVSATNKTFTVNGTWNFPFALNKVFRADLRRSGSNGCTKWSVLADGQISTRNNTNVDKMAAENLFYLKGHGYNSDNRLIVTLHSIAFDDNQGFNCTTNNNAQGKISDDPTQWIVKLNSSSKADDPGISLQHNGSSITHANDISGRLGVWAATYSQNDGGSFIRFFDLTEDDFAATSFEKDGVFYIFDAAAMATVKANPTSENVRALFATATEATSATVTVNLQYKGQTIKTVEISDVVGSEHSVEAPVFFNDVITVTIPANGGTINVALEHLALPFKHTETADNMIWQAVHIHASYAANIGYTWTYTEDDSKTIIEPRPANIANEGYADTQLWAFVGDYNNGFKIYNKAAGTDKWLYGTSTHVMVGTTETNSLWKPYANSVKLSNDTYCCLKSADTQYINLNVAADNATTLTYWGGADQGSSCWFVAPAEPMIATAQGFTFMAEGDEYTGPKNAVGAIDYNGVDFSGAAAIIAAASENMYDTDAAEALRNLIALYNANVTVNTLEPNGYYRIQNILFANDYVYTSATDENLYSKRYENEDYRTDYHSIFKFEPVAGEADRYYLQSQGLYVGHVGGTAPSNVSGPTQTADENERGEFSLVTINHDDNPDVPTCAAFAIKDMTQTDYNFFHQGADAGEGSYRITAWRQWAHGSHFYVLKAEHIDVALTEPHDGMNVGFGYFPFAVSASDADTKLYYIHESYDKETGAPVVTYNEVSAVPAHTAFMVSHPGATSVSLAIGTPVAAASVRRVIEAEGSNDITDGFADTDSWTPDTWTELEAAPEQIAALGISNARYMQRTLTFDNGGDLALDFVYSKGSERVDLCGVALINAEGEIVSGDFHIGYSGTQKIDKVYTVKVPTAGTYTVRYYISNQDNRMDTNGDVYITFVSKDNFNLLHGHLRETEVKAGDYVLGQTSKGFGFIKATEATAVAGNYVYIPAENFYDNAMTAVDEMPLVQPDKTTGIQEIGADQSAAAKVVYDLQGRRLSAPVKGINIINGVKVLVK